MSGAAGPSPPSTTISTSAKVSKFAVKSGFVIPKNKLSGSLVPIYRDKKSAGADAATKESNKQLQRKTKWGPDPTQDAAVRKGRSLAYQTRVDQIVQQLKTGKLDFDDNLDSATAEQLDENILRHDSKKSKLLELEKMELIGEILKLNANYKAPPDYKPLLKEDRVTIPVKEFPGYNFIGLIFGPGGDNRKQLEKETGAKIQVYGIKPGKDKGEIIPSDANGVQGYDEIYVHISADTFEKIDAAVAIIDLLVTSVSGNNLAGASTVSVDNKNTQNATSSQALTNVAPEEVSNPVSENLRAPPTGQFQYTAPWFTSVGSSMPPPSGFVPPPSSAPYNNTTHQQPPPLNPANIALPFGSQPLAGFNFPPQNPTLAPQRLQHPPQVNQYMSQSRPSNVNAAISNQSSFPFSGSQPLQSAPFSRPLLSQQSSFPSGPSMQNSLPLQPNHPPLHSNFHSQLNPLPSRSLAPPFQPGPSSFSGPMQNFPTNRPSMVSAPHPNSGDFTFQPQRPHPSQNFQPGPGNRPPHHILPPPPPFRSDLHHQMQPFSRQPMLQPNRQPMFQNYGPSQPPPPPVHQLGRQMNYGAANPGPAFPSRPRNFMEPQQMYRGQMAPRDMLPPPNQQFRHNPSFGGQYNRPPGPGELQVYDPFSPTSVANMRPRQDDNSGPVRRRENDPEYEDLMASVGVS